MVCAMPNVNSYENLCAVDRDAAPLQHAASILGWDQEVNMPAKGLAQRSAALAGLAGEMHKRYCQPQIAEWLSDCESDPFPAGSVEAANVSLWREGYDRRTKFPGEFIEEKSRTSSEAKAAWAEARKKSDFSLFAPLLERQVDIARREADYIGYVDQPYDALIEKFERGMTTANLQGIFGSFRGELTQIAGEAVERAEANPLGVVRHQGLPAQDLMKGLLEEAEVLLLGARAELQRLEGLGVRLDDERARLWLELIGVALQHALGLLDEIEGEGLEALTRPEPHEVALAPLDAGHEVVMEAFAHGAVDAVRSHDEVGARERGWIVDGILVAQLDAELLRTEAQLLQHASARDAAEAVSARAHDVAAMTHVDAVPIGEALAHRAVALGVGELEVAHGLVREDHTPTGDKVPRAALVHDDARLGKRQLGQDGEVEPARPSADAMDGLRRRGLVGDHDVSIVRSARRAATGGTRLLERLGYSK